MIVRCSPAVACGPWSVAKVCLKIRVANETSMNRALIPGRLHRAVTRASPSFERCSELGEARQRFLAFGNVIIYLGLYAPR